MRSHGVQVRPGSFLPGLAAALFSAADDEAAFTRREGGSALSEVCRPGGSRRGHLDPEVDAVEVSTDSPKGEGASAGHTFQIPGLDVVFAAALTHNASTSAALVLSRAVEQSLVTVSGKPDAVRHR